MKNILHTLLKLSEIDTHLTRLKDAKTKLPLLVTEIQNHLQKLQHDLAGVDSQVATLEKQKQDTAFVITEKQEWILKREALINDIKTTKEYQASVKEIATAKKEILDKTALLLTIDTNIQDAQKKTEDTTALIKPKISELEGKLQDCQNKIVSVDPKIADKQAERSTLLNTLSADIQAQYANTQKRVNPALACASTKICSECGSRVPPQIINQLMVNKELQSCSSCRRILYLDEALYAERFFTLCRNQIFGPRRIKCHRHQHVVTTRGLHHRLFGIDRDLARHTATRRGQCHENTHGRIRSFNIVNQAQIYQTQRNLRILDSFEGFANLFDAWHIFPFLTAHVSLSSASS